MDSFELTTGETKVSVELPFRYRLLRPKTNTPPNTPRELILVFHGYQERAERTLRQIQSTLPEDAVVLAPNGPFPVPVITSNGSKEAYSWYFYDVKSQTFLIRPEPALHMISNLIQSLGFQNLPVRIVGFSQGGYFASIAGHRLANVHHVIGLSCGYPARYFQSPPRFQLDAIHGEKDKVAPFQIAYSEHAALRHAGWQGEFIRLPETEHAIDEAMQRELGHLLRKPLHRPASPGAESESETEKNQTTSSHHS